MAVLKVAEQTAVMGQHVKETAERAKERTTRKEQEAQSPVCYADDKAWTSVKTMAAGSLQVYDSTQQGLSLSQQAMRRVIVDRQKKMHQSQASQQPNPVQHPLAENMPNNSLFGKESVKQAVTQQAQKQAVQKKLQAKQFSDKNTALQQTAENVQNNSLFGTESVKQAVVQKAQKQAVQKKQQAKRLSDKKTDIQQTEIDAVRADVSGEQPVQKAVAQKRAEPQKQSVKSEQLPEKPVQAKEARPLSNGVYKRERKSLFGREPAQKPKQTPVSDGGTIIPKQVLQRKLFKKQMTQNSPKPPIRSVSDFFYQLSQAFSTAARSTAGGAMNILAVVGASTALIVIMMVAFIGGFLASGQNSSYQDVSAEVHAYEPMIRQYATRYGIPEYTELLMAVMMQESGGTGGDPMQAAEGPFNTRYPHEPNGITDPEYSIQCGVQELKSCLIAAGSESPMDIEHISLALQGYNFGNGYITWAVNHYGGYSAANAQEFSQIQAQRMGWSRYGDVEYVPHVLRYYPYSRINLGGGSQDIVDVAITQLGNVGGDPYWRWYGFSSHVHWCACFVSWCADQCGYLDAGIIPKHAACQDGANWFRSHGQWQSRSYVPSAGDIIYFDWNGDGHTEHVGIVEYVENGVVYTVEGNASNTCARRHYTVGNSQIYGYGIPQYR